ncbi:MAG: hypothetical protein U0521_24955 [Anaerolineae bacterium]
MGLLDDPAVEGELGRGIGAKTLRQLSNALSSPTQERMASARRSYLPMMDNRFIL